MTDFDQAFDQAAAEAAQDPANQLGLSDQDGRQPQRTALKPPLSE